MDHIGNQFHNDVLCMAVDQNYQCTNRCKNKQIASRSSKYAIA